jgi:hypothetical protein
MKGFVMNIFQKAFTRKLAKIRAEYAEYCSKNTDNPMFEDYVADYEKRQLRRSVLIVAGACAATLAFAVIARAAEECNSEMID